VIGIILTILKWIGILLLAVLGVVLAILLILLLVPVRYRIQGARSPGDCILTAKGKVSWLASILAVTFIYDQEFSWRIRFFGIPVKKKDSETDQNNAELSEEDITQIAALEAELETEQAQSKVEDHTERKQRVFSPKESVTEDTFAETSAYPVESAIPKSEETEKPKVSFKERIQGIRQKAGETLHSIPKKVEEIREKIHSLKQQAETWMAFVKSDEVKQLLSTCWKQIKRILKHLMPTGLQIRGNYGFADPSLTGKITGFIYALPPRYQKGIQLQPHFQEECLDGEVSIKGRIRLGSLVWPVVKILLKPCTWRVYKKFKAISKKVEAAGDTHNTKTKKIKNDPNKGGNHNG